MENKNMNHAVWRGSEDQKLGRTEAESCKPYNEFEDTVHLMLGEDYKDRFVAEYRQTKIRYERLKRFNTKIEAARRQRSGNPVDWTGMVSQILGAKSVTENDNKWVTEPKHDCPEELLREQQRVMGEYLHILEVRAVIEGIDL